MLLPSKNTRVLIFSSLSIFIGLQQTAEAADLCKLKNEKIAATVEKVSDGDTISVYVDNKKYGVRFLSIDTPELHFQWDGVWHNQGPIAMDAKDHMDTLLKKGDKVTLEFDQESCDTYGRLLAYVWKGNVNMNQAMIQSKLAYNYCISPNLKYCENFSKIVAEVSASGEGIYGVQGLEEPYLWRSKIRGESPKRPVADIRTKKVYPANHVSKIKMPYRVFFNTESDVKPPYVMATGR